MKVYIQHITISYTISDHGIHFNNDDALHELIKQSPKTGVKLLVKEVKHQFFLQNNRELQITDESLMTEIWGHYYFEVLFNTFKWIPKMFSFTKLIQLIETSTKEYDCAEKGTDPNRFIWDFLSYFKPIFKLFLRDKPL